MDQTVTKDGTNIVIKSFLKPQIKIALFQLTVATTLFGLGIFLKAKLLEWGIIEKILEDWYSQKMFIEKGYDATALEKEIQQVANMDRDSLLQTLNKKEQPRLVRPFLPASLFDTHTN